MYMVLKYKTPIVSQSITIGNLNFTGTITNNESAYAPNTPNTNSTFTNVSARNISSGTLSVSPSVLENRFGSLFTSRIDLTRNTTVANILLSPSFVYCAFGGINQNSTSGVLYNPNGVVAVSMGNGMHITKYDKSLNYVSHNSFNSNGANTNTIGTLIVDSSENLYVLGSFSSIGSFSASNGTLTTTITGISGTVRYSFIAKYNSTGSLQYVSDSLVSNSTIGSFSVYRDSSIGIALTISGGNSVYNTNGAIVTTISTNNQDILYSRYNSVGSYSYSNKIGGSGTDFAASSVNLDTIGNTIVAGYTRSTQCNFFATDGSTVLGTIGSLTTGSNTQFLAQYNSVGSLNYTLTIKTGSTAGNLIAPVLLNDSRGNNALLSMCNGSEIFVYATDGSTVQNSIGSTTLSDTQKRTNTALYTQFSSNGTLLQSYAVMPANASSTLTGLNGYTDSSGNVLLSVVGATTPMALYGSNGNIIIDSFMPQSTFPSSATFNYMYFMNSSGTLRYCVESDIALTSFRATQNQEFYFTTLSRNFAVRNTSGVLYSYNTNNTASSIYKLDSQGSLVNTMTSINSAKVSVVPLLSTLGDEVLSRHAFFNATTVYITNSTLDTIETFGNTITDTNNSDTITLTMYSSGNFASPIRLNTDGDLTVYGNINVYGTKNFKISHPDPEKRNDGYVLRHSALETPSRGDNIYRYNVVTKNGLGYIELPDYFDYINENVMIICEASGSHFGRAYGVREGVDTVRVVSDTDGEYIVIIIGTRTN